MKNRVTKLLALFLMLSMVFALASCLPELGSSSKDKDNDEDEAKSTEVQTSEMAGIENRLDSLERNYELTYHRLNYNERIEAVEYLYRWTSINGEMIKGYRVEQNSRIAYVYEFQKQADAKNAENAIQNAMHNDYDFQSSFGDKTYGLSNIRKNCVLVFGSSNLVDMILSKNNTARPDATTDTHYATDTTAPSYTTGYPSYTEPSYTVPSYTTDYPYYTDEPSYNEPSNRISEDMKKLMKRIDSYLHDKSLSYYDDITLSEAMNIRSELIYQGAYLEGEINSVIRAASSPSDGYWEATLIDFESANDAYAAYWTYYNKNSDPNFNPDMQLLRIGNVVIKGDIKILDLFRYY